MLIGTTRRTTKWNLLYSVSFARFPAFAASPITQATVDGPGLTITGQTFAGQRVFFRISGGTPRTTTNVNVTVQNAAGDTADGDLAVETE